MGGLASFLCGDDDDNFDASKTNNQLLHHHPYALHVHHNVSSSNTTHSGGGNINTGVETRSNLSTLESNDQGNKELQGFNHNPNDHLQKF
jgi:hypothetical protein